MNGDSKSTRSQPTDPSARWRGMERTMHLVIILLLLILVVVAAVRP